MPITKMDILKKVWSLKHYHCFSAPVSYQVS